MRIGGEILGGVSDILINMAKAGVDAVAQQAAGDKKKADEKKKPADAFDNAKKQVADRAARQSSSMTWLLLGVVLYGFASKR